MTTATKKLEPITLDVPQTEKKRKPSNKQKKVKEPKAKKVYEMNGIIFKNAEALKYYKKLNDLLNEGKIHSFDVTSLSINQPKTKYGANKIGINGVIFDSMLESDYFLYLLEERKTGNISDFELKPSFVLLPSFKKNGQLFRKIKYIADFKVFYKNGDTVIVDTKGVMTPDFKLKQKMFEYNYPELSLKVLKFVKSYGGWIEYDRWMKEKKVRKKNK